MFPFPFFFFFSFFFFSCFLVFFFFLFLFFFFSFFFSFNLIRVKESEARLQHPIPQSYKSFLEKLEHCHGVRTPAHMWGENGMAVASLEPAISIPLLPLLYGV
jgi:hypothetical protein